MIFYKHNSVICIIYLRNLYSYHSSIHAPFIRVYKKYQCFNNTENITKACVGRRIIQKKSRFVGWGQHVRFIYFNLCPTTPPPAYKCPITFISYRSIFHFELIKFIRPFCSVWIPIPLNRSSRPKASSCCVIHKI